MEEAKMLTTYDNPYNPFVNFDKWYMFDCEKGYMTSGRIARIVNLTKEMTQKEIEAERVRACKLILNFDPLGIYFQGTEEEIQTWIEQMNKKANMNDEDAPAKEE